MEIFTGIGILAILLVYVDLQIAAKPRQIVDCKRKSDNLVGRGYAVIKGENALVGIVFYIAGRLRQQLKCRLPVRTKL